MPAWLQCAEQMLKYRLLLYLQQLRSNNIKRDSEISKKDHLGRQFLGAQLIRLMRCFSFKSDLFGVFRSSIQRELGCAVGFFLIVFGNDAPWISYWQH